MKSEYRQAVESVIAQEAKLAEVKALYAKAASEEKKLAEAVQLNQEALARYEARATEIENAMFAGQVGLGKALQDIDATLKYLAREIMRPEAPLPV